MSCLCTQKVAQTVAGLLPLAPLAIDLPPIPDVLSQLATTPGGGSPVVKMSDNTKQQLGTLLALKLPPVPVSAGVLAQLQGIVPTVLHVKNTLGINLLAPKPALGPIMKQVNAALPGLLPLADLDPGPLLNLASLLMLLKALKNSLGLNLMKPGMRAQLAVALNAQPLFPLAPLQAAAPLGILASTLAALNVSLTAPDALPKLSASLAALAALPIPPLAVEPVALARISGLLMATSVTKQLLGFNPVGNGPRLAVTLAPLQELEGLAVSPALAQAALAGTLISTVMPLLKVNPKALPALKVPVPAALPIPDLSAVATAGSIMSYGLGSPAACGEACPLAGQFAATGLIGRVSSLFS